MFRCDICDKVVPPGTPARHVIAETRDKHYPRRPGAHQAVLLTRNGRRKSKQVDDPGGNGEEIVEELLVCPACAREHGAA
jgi:hypothetical protein